MENRIIVPYYFYSRKILQRKPRSVGGFVPEIGADLTLEYVEDILNNQKGRCAYTGLLIGLPNSSKDLACGSYTASIDRIDSSKGYIRGNIQWVHKDVNRMKQQFSHEVFVNYCKLIANNFRK